MALRLGGSESLDSESLGALGALPRVFDLVCLGLGLGLEICISNGFLGSGSAWWRRTLMIPAVGISSRKRYFEQEKN